MTRLRSVTGAPRYLFAVGATLGLWLTMCTAAEPSCPAAGGRLLYVPVDTVTEPLGLRGETRAQYLNRRYGPGGWQLDEQAAIVAIAPPQTSGAPYHVRITEPLGAALARADVIVEARIAYLGADGSVTAIYGHREAASYLLTPGADAAIRVPPDLFKEEGALLVAVTLVGGEDSRLPVRVAAAPVPQAASSCACCVYVADRFTAIRLNRAQNAPGQ